MAVSAKPVDSNMPPKELSRDADWSVVQNINGKNTITSHPYDFPMEGEWTKEFNEVGPSASATVANGRAGSVAVAQNLKASTPRPVSGRLYQAFWYVPEIKNHIKLIVEDDQSGGALNKRITEELESSLLSK